VSENLEDLSIDEIEEIIELNRNIVQRRGQDFEADTEKIRKFFATLNVYDDVKDHRTRIVKKAGRILGGLAWHQYFNEANKETSIHITIYYLRKNGYDLHLQSEGAQKELYNLLVRTVEKFPEDRTVYKEVEEYLDRKVVAVNRPRE
jgi:prophage maintenance system killer protein